MKFFHPILCTPITNEIHNIGHEFHYFDCNLNVSQLVGSVIQSVPIKTNLLIKASHTCEIIVMFAIAMVYWTGEISLPHLY